MKNFILIMEKVIPNQLNNILWMGNTFRHLNQQQKHVNCTIVTSHQFLGLSREDKKLLVVSFGNTKTNQYLLTMDKLIQTIQDEINQLMNSKSAQKSDAQLVFHDKSLIGTKIIIQKIVDEYNQSKKTLEQLCLENNISRSTFSIRCQQYGIECSTSQKGTERRYCLQEKYNDIQSGMRFKEYHLKWKVSKYSYYTLKKKLKKDLVD